MFGSVKSLYGDMTLLWTTYSNNQELNHNVFINDNSVGNEQLILDLKWFVTIL